MKGRPAKRVILQNDQREELKRLKRQSRKNRGVAFRSQLILLCAEGMADTAVAKEARTTGWTVGFWRKRFLEGGIEALFDEPRSGAPRRIDDESIEDLVTKTLQSIPENATHWSTRLMARKLGLSQSTVSRVWRAFGLQPHRAETFVLSKDPQLVRKVRDVVGLYLSPPVNAVVLSVDEKSQSRSSMPSPALLQEPPKHTPRDFYKKSMTQETRRRKRKSNLS